MNLETFLTTPAPAHAFALDDKALAYARATRTRETLERIEAVPIAGAWCALGPVGLLQVDRELLHGAIAALVQRLDKPPAKASLVIPNAWVRAVAVDVGVLPRHRQEAEDVVRWRLKKLLPCRPEEVRLDFIPSGENGRVVVLLALDRPFTILEEAFAAGGVALGRMVPSVLTFPSLVPQESSTRVVAVIDETALGLVIITGGRIKLVRHKGLPTGNGRREALIVRELGQTVEHARELDGGEGEPAVCWVATADGSSEGVIGEWALAHPEVAVRYFDPEPLLPPHAGGLSPLTTCSLLGVVRERVR
jgi:hypothetical protein